jgi:hypothetical protein
MSTAIIIHPSIRNSCLRMAPNQSILVQVHQQITKLLQCFTKKNTLDDNSSSRKIYSSKKETTATVIMIHCILIYTHFEQIRPHQQILQYHNLNNEELNKTIAR